VLLSMVRNLRIGMFAACLVRLGCAIYSAAVVGLRPDPAESVDAVHWRAVAAHAGANSADVALAPLGRLVRMSVVGRLWAIAQFSLSCVSGESGVSSVNSESRWLPEPDRHECEYPSTALFYAGFGALIWPA
jgi:hypothetical protein